VLEHLFNPLFCLEQMKKALHSTGVIYLSTPYRNHLIWGNRHFHEIDDKRIRWLFAAAGLEIIKQAKIAIRFQWYWHLSGIRPLLRLFQKTRIYKLKVATQ